MHAGISHGMAPCELKYNFKFCNWTIVAYNLIGRYTHIIYTSSTQELVYLYMCMSQIETNMPYSAHYSQPFTDKPQLTLE